MGTVRTLVVEKHLVFASALAEALAARPGLDVVGCSDRPNEVPTLLQRLEPEILLIDLSLWERRDVGAACAASAAAPVVITESLDPVETANALRDRACGVVSHSASVDEVVDAIETVAAGGRAIAHELVSGVLTELLSASARPTEDESRIRTLSPRELEVLSHLLCGMGRREIADRMFISANTVRSHIGNILRKLEVGSVVGAVAVGNRTGVEPACPIRRLVLDQR